MAAPRPAVRPKEKDRVKGSHVVPDNPGETAPPDRAAAVMNEQLEGPPEMRRADCPFCEHQVLVYEEPPRCPLCACPLEDDRIEPYAWPDGEPSPSD